MHTVIKARKRIYRKRLLKEIIAVIAMILIGAMIVIASVMSHLNN